MTICPDCGWHEPPVDTERPWWNPNAEYAGLVLELDAILHPATGHRPRSPSDPQAQRERVDA